MIVDDIRGTWYIGFIFRNMSFRTRGKPRLRIKEWIIQHYRIVLIGTAAAVILFFAIFAAVRLAGKKRTESAEGFPVRINEVMVSNGAYPNDDGVRCDYIELYNDSDRKVVLDGYQLGDKKSGDRYTFPENTVIKAHGYLVVSCSKDTAGPYYAAFGLSKNGGEDIYFLDPGSMVIETVKTLAADKDTAQGLDESGVWTLLPFGTPGYPNTQEGYRTWSTYHTVTYSSDVRINEIMTSNSIYRVSGGECTDWIELYNTTDAPIRLDGFGLSDNNSEPSGLFPEDTVLEAGGYLVVPCASDGEGPARFALKKTGGESVTLFHADGTVADMVQTVPAERNQAYARAEDGSWKLTFDATPGFANTPEGREAYVRSSEPGNAEIRITEIMADNKSIYADATGLFHDWVELTNVGKTACSISGWFLSDDENDLTQWRIPDYTLNAGESVAVFFAGNRDGVIGGELFAPMSLSAAGEAVYLTDPIGGLRETVSFGPMDENRSLTIDPATGEQRVCAYPTPGYPNTAEGYDAFSRQLKSKGALAVWEVMTANDAYLSQSGEYYDWLELKNVSDAPIDLSSYSISDDAKRPGRFVLPEVRLGPGEFYVLILSGHPEYSTDRYRHASFALNAQEDDLFLFESGKLIDYTHLFMIPYHNSCGRSADEGGFFYMDPTPGRENEAGVRMISSEPTASVASGVYNGVTGIDVTLEAEGTIYYTTDCSDPDRNATVYTGPIHLDRTTVLRSVSYEPEKKESRILTCSYLINEEHDLPIVSLVTDPEHLWNAATGIYVDGLSRKEIEYPADAAYFGPDGSWETACGIKMHGLTSLMKQPKKSFTLKFSGVYDGPLHYDVYGDGAVTVFKSLILRADAESAYATFLRDNLLHRIAKEYSSAMLSQNSKYAVLYLNGRYWGIYSIREQYTPFFYASNMGVPEDTVTISKNFIRGETTLSEAMYYTLSHRMTSEEDYAYIAERIDVMSFIDWAIFQAYCGNFDIDGNMRYLYSTVDGKWRCGLVDVDLGMCSLNGFLIVFKTGQIGPMLRAMLKNETFRQQFLTRMAELLSTGFSESSVLETIDRMTAEIRSEIPNEVKRWGGPRNWESMVDEVKDFADKTVPVMIKSIQKEIGLSNEEIQTYFGELLP